MLKKVFLSAMVAALALTACDSDSSTSPKNDEQPKGNVSEQPGTINGDGANNTVVKTDPVSANTSAEVPCSVEKTSANSFVMKMQEEGVLTTITTTIVGGQAEIDYVSVYDASVPEATIEQICAANKQEALEKSAAVTCEGRTMTIHEVDDAEIGFDGALKSAENVCKSMNAYLSENTSQNAGLSEETGLNESPVIDTNPTTDITSDKATCQVTEQTTTTLKMVMVQPDSGTIYTSYEYKDGTFETVMRFEFLSTMSLEEINNFCAESKAEGAEMAAEAGVVMDVNCEDYGITMTITEQAPMNVMPYLAKDMIEYCNEIQETGVIPEDDDEEDFF